MDLPRPKYLSSIEDDIARERAYDRFLIQLLGLLIDPQGQVRHVAPALGINYHTLRSQISRSRGRRLTERERGSVTALLHDYSEKS